MVPIQRVQRPGVTRPQAERRAFDERRFPLDGSRSAAFWLGNYLNPNGSLVRPANGNGYSAMRRG